MEKVRKANCNASKSLQLQLQVLNYDQNMVAVVPRRFFVLFEQLRTRYDFFFCAYKCARNHISKAVMNSVMS